MWSCKFCTRLIRCVEFLRENSRKHGRKRNDKMLIEKKTLCSKLYDLYDFVSLLVVEQKELPFGFVSTVWFSRLETHRNFAELPCVSIETASTAWTSWRRLVVQLFQIVNLTTDKTDEAHTHTTLTVWTWTPCCIQSKQVQNLSPPNKQNKQ